MKKLSFILSLILLISVVFLGCKKDEEIIEEKNIVPTTFSIEIPSALSQATKTSLKCHGPDGSEIYEYMAAFINVGEEAAETIQKIMDVIGDYELNQAMSFSYTSEEDSLVKNVVIIENVEFEGQTWEFQMTITDAESESNEDGGVAAQVFWNREPVKGIAIIKPSNLIRKSTEAKCEQYCIVMYRVDYSEAGENGYENQMVVSISDLISGKPGDSFALNTLKMFAGRKGDIIDVYGNTNHPNARFFSDEVGYNWAFVAAGDETQDIGVAEVALPPSELNFDTDDIETLRQGILKDYAMKVVCEREILAAYPGTTQEQLDIFLKNMEAPGYFDQTGFVAAGTSPGTQYDAIEASMNLLAPYIPYNVTHLEISFKE